MSATVRIPEIFRGPPRSGNGGYVSGVFAGLLKQHAPDGVEVTLRSPVPLDRDMSAIQTDDALQIVDGESLIAEVRPSKFELTIPKPPGFEAALALQSGSLSLQPREGDSESIRGMHPWCYCCGAEHEDGLYVFASRLDESQTVAAWSTHKSWGDADGMLTPPTLWTALDCPGQVAFAVEGIRTGLLGRITANIHRSAPAGENYVVAAWREGIEGKKHFAGTAIFDRRGELVASARSVWIGRRN